MVIFIAYRKRCKLIRLQLLYTCYHDKGGYVFISTPGLPKLFMINQ